ncbi:MAG: SNF2 family helicase [Methylacidiphilales bacterium]|nr:SNF2 family helicase [Candidatus Methylacidiphilales bacterium]
MPILELNTSLLVDIGGWPALKEARELIEREKVLDVAREGAVIRARVQGVEKIHDVQITLAERVAHIEVRCTCVESRRSGRVCAHTLAAGLALLQPATGYRPRVAADVPIGGAVGSRHTPCDGPIRYPSEEAPAGIPLLEITVLLPLQLAEAARKDPVRIILEGRRSNEEQTRPWDIVLREAANDFAVTEDDERVLAALEQMTGTTGGINAVPRAKMGHFLRTLDGHPRVWLGKKQRIDVRATADRPRIELKNLADGALELTFENWTSTEKQPPELIPGWSFDGSSIVETPAAPAGFISGRRMIPHAQIPDFLTREWSQLEKNYELAFAPGFEEFRLETGTPEIEARLEGALSGLTLELIARYGGKEFALKPSPDERGPAGGYFPDERQKNRFRHRNLVAEKEALARAESAGFSLMRTNATTLSLGTENRVARFLANTLPRWRQQWSVRFGPRLEATMREIDVAEPEFSLHRRGSGEDWLGLDLKLAVGGQPVPLDQAEIERWLQTGKSHARTANNRVLLVPTESWGEMKEVLADCAVEQEPGSIRVASRFAPFLAGALKAQGFHAGGKISDDFQPPDVKGKVAADLWAQLRPYQAQGVTWLAGLAAQNLNGLLADDMGLGKTLQALAFCAWLKKTTQGKGAFLVVCPTSLVVNWLREAARFTPHLRTLDLTGTDRTEKWAKRNDHDLLVTSYAILRRDIELYRESEFALVVLDEAQHIKNRASQNAQSAKALKSRHRLVLTGTPLENSVLDLWSIYDFLLPGYLGTATDFRERYETPLIRGPANTPDTRTMERLRHRVRPFFLRRTKEEVLTDLPPKLEHLTLCELSDEQREVYRAVLAEGRREVFEHSGKARHGRDKIAVLTTLLRLRQVCCHLDLLPGKTAPPMGTSAATNETSLRRWKEPSAKMERTFELIDEAIDGGHRVLLFSQFVRALHLLRDEAKKREIRFCYLDGQTVERQAEVDRFQNDAEIPLFFISLKAGGTGLNLTGADTVIHFDPWWNPAVEEQATARAHRLGQARKVQAYKLIAAGTVEEKIQLLQARKRELFEASLGGDEALAEKLTGDDLEELLAD